MPYGIARFIGRRQPAIFAALPPTAFLPRKNSTGLFGEGKSDDGKEEDAGILAYAKDDDTARKNRMCSCQAKVLSFYHKGGVLANVLCGFMEKIQAIPFDMPNILLNFGHL